MIESIQIGTSIGVFSATDDDISSNGKISFSLLEVSQWRE